MSTIHTTFLNYREQGPDMEHSEMPSETQPDEVMSIREMMERHARGLPVGGSLNEGHYYDDLEIPDLQTLDLTEIEDLRDYYTSETERMKEYLSKHQEPDEVGKPKTSDGQIASDSDPDPTEAT